jgi:bifunctional non-homologous end joining protein LigD
MLASLDEPPIARRGMIYEPKYDGIRALVDLRPAARKGLAPHVALYSRNGIEKTAQFPAVTKALATIAARLAGPVLLDGELVAVDANGRALGFQHIQGRIHRTAAADILKGEAMQPVVLRVFDLLRNGDDDLRGEPLAARRLALQRTIKPTGVARDLVKLSEIAADDGRPMKERAEAEGWEGLIVKDGQSVYHSGRRTPAWRKLKLHKNQEFVVGGWTDPRQTRSHFGSLLLGYYEDDRARRATPGAPERGRAGVGPREQLKEDSALRWAGSVGTGFDQHELDRVAGLLRALATPKSPFADAFKTMERPHWVKPEIVVQVRFTEWTAEGLLRHPVYLGTRDDKDPREVRREDAGRAAPKPALAPTGRYSRNRRIDRMERPVRLRSASARPAEAGSTGSNAKNPAGLKTGRSIQTGRSLQDLLDLLRDLEKTKKDAEIELPNGDRLRVTNLAKLFWKSLGITKGDLMRYYVEVSPMLLPAVDDRPLVMKRFPNGVDIEGPKFYQQRHPEAVPPGVRREVLPDDIEPITEEGPRDRLIGGSLTTLVYMAQLAAISQDPWFSRVADPMHPDVVAIDLDPGEGATFDKVLDVARWVKEELDRLQIPGVPKTSGASGLHVYVPLPPETTYETGQLLCQVIATIVATKHPKIATVERTVKRRPRGTVYVDYLQNILGKTIATAYSARASDYAGVSTPLTWKEVEKGVDPRDFTIRTAMARFREVGDLWAPVRTGKRVNIQAVLKRSGAL